jgi:hypothetical protein
MILAEPTSFNLNGPGCGGFPAIANKGLSQVSKPLREVGQQFRGNLAFVSARAKYMRYR